MKRRVRVSLLATDDIRRLAAFLRPKNPRAAKEASATIKRAIRSLSELSERGRPSAARPGHRELVVPFGSAAYVVQYRVEDDTVVVFRISHSREMPPS